MSLLTQEIQVMYTCFKICDTFLFRPLRNIVGGVLNRVWITGEVIGISDLKWIKEQSRSLHCKVFV